MAPVRRPGVAALDAAVADARARTDADWRVVCIDRADPGHRAADVLAVAAGLAAMLTAAALLPSADTSGESWDGMGPAARALLATAAGVLGALLGAAVAGRSAALRRAVTPESARVNAAAAAARSAFAADRADLSARPRIFVHATLAERRVVVLAKTDGHSRPGVAELDTLCRLVTEPLINNDGDPLVALSRGVRAAADHLAAHPPTSA